MFKVGFYNITTIEDGVPCSRGGAEIVAVEGNLIRVRFGDGERILNTSASTFVSAEPTAAPPPFALAVEGVALPQR